MILKEVIQSQKFYFEIILIFFKKIRGEGGRGDFLKNNIQSNFIGLNHFPFFKYFLKILIDAPHLFCSDF